MDDASHPNVIFESKCCPKYVMHCNPSLYALLIDLKETDGILNRPVSEIFQAIQQKTIHWLIRVGGQISCPPHDPPTHKCCIPTLSFQQQLDLLSSIVYQAIFQETDKDTYRFSSSNTEQLLMVDQTITCTTVILSLNCKTQFSIIRNKVLDDCVHYIDNQLAISPTTSTSTLVTSWMIRKKPLIGVHASAQRVEGFNIIDVPNIPVDYDSFPTDLYNPPTVSPFLSLIEHHVLLNMSSAHAQIDTILPAASQYTPPQETIHRLPSPYKTPQRSTDTSTTTNLPSDTTDIASPPTRKQQKLFHNQFALHSYSTRSRNEKIAAFLGSISRSKSAIKYVQSGTKRHMPGEKAIVKPPCDSHVSIPDCDKFPEILLERTFQFYSLLNFWTSLKKDGINVPRDSWEDWVDSSITADDPQADKAFMFLMTICMSASTSDAQLSTVMPRIFSFGLTSATAVIDISQRYGMDALCSILSEPGRFYKNAEHIVNAADYFIQEHNGVIPTNISIQELTTLLGIGYKTAAIVIEASFDRSEGIPSDIHVMRWSQNLGWVPTKCEAYECSKHLESWVPQKFWRDINPLLGSLSQIAVSGEGSKVRERLAKSKNFCPFFKKKVISMFDKYMDKRKSY